MLGWGFDLRLVHPTLPRRRTQRIWKRSLDDGDRWGRRKFGEAGAAQGHAAPEILRAEILGRDLDQFPKNVSLATWTFVSNCRLRGSM